MFADDYIMRQIDAVSRALGKILMNKSIPSEEIVNPDGSISESAMNKKVLLKKLEEGKINEAEDFLFKFIEESRDPGYIDMAIWFYKELNKLSDKELLAADFSRDEIKDGLEAITKIIEDFDNFEV